jgi:hypothetical protein
MAGVPNAGTVSGMDTQLPYAENLHDALFVLALTRPKTILVISQPAGKALHAPTPQFAAPIATPHIKPQTQIAPSVLRLELSTQLQW